MIVVHLPGYLGEIVGKHGRIEIEGDPKTLGEALERLVALHPGLRDRIQDEQGAVRPHVNVFVGSLNSRDTGGLATALGAGAQIRIFPAVSGG